MSNVQLAVVIAVKERATDVRRSREYQRVIRFPHANQEIVGRLTSVMHMLANYPCRVIARSVKDISQG